MVTIESPKRAETGRTFSMAIQVETEGEFAGWSRFASRDTFEGILNGDTNPTMAYMSGKLKIDGSLPAAMKLGGALS